MNPCSFCKQLEAKKTKINDIEINRIIYESKNFVVFPALGQIVEGYLLIIPKQHYISIVQIPDNLYFELEQVQEKVKNLLTKNYSEPIFFEHGPLSENEKAGCCIDHAHLHCVPVSVSILEEITKHFEYQKIDNFSQLPTHLPYLYLEENNKKYSFPIKTILPHQYLRQILAVKTNNPEKWDWRTHPELEKVQNTIQKLKEKFK